MNTPTPRTDEWLEEEKRNPRISGLGNWLDYCKTLERELTAAREELAEWSILNGWGGTPEIINEFIKGQQTRIYYERNLEEDLTLAQEEITLLKNAIANNNDAARAEYIDLKEQRDRLLEQQEQWRLSSVCRELVEQRDRLAEALESIVGESAYEGLPESKQQAIEQALQSLNQNAQGHSTPTENL